MEQHKTNLKVSKRLSWLPSIRNNTLKSHDTLSMKSVSTTTLNASQSDIKHAHAFALQLAASPVLNLNLVNSTGNSNAQSNVQGSKNPMTVIPNNASIHAPATPATRQVRSTSETPRLADLPRLLPLSPNMTTTPGGGLKMPPSVVTRHMPLPIQRLPSLPPASSSRSNGASLPSSRTSRPSIRSVPSLPRIGHDDERDRDDMDPDMEGIDEEEDEEEVRHLNMLDDPQSDSSGSIQQEHMHSINKREADREHSVTLNIPGHCPLQTHYGSTAQLPDLEAPDAQTGNSESNRPFSQSTAVVSDYFSQQPSSSSQGRHLPFIVTTAPSPGTPPASASYYDHDSSKHIPLIHSKTPTSHPDPLKLSTLSPQKLIATKSLAPAYSAAENTSGGRPSFYRQLSRSMNSLVLPTPGPFPSAVDTGPRVKSTNPPTNNPALRRRTSTPGINPPTYNSPLPTPDPAVYAVSKLKSYRAEPRDDEGIEQLPEYELTVPLLTSLMPRKMEFVKPGEQAEDRRWRRVWCVLHGTTFKVYEGEKGWEKVEGWLGRQLKPGHTPNGGKDRIKIKSVSQIDDDGQKYVSPPTVGHGSFSSQTGPDLDRRSISSQRSHYASSSRTSVSVSRRSSMSTMNNNQLPTNSSSSPNLGHRRVRSNLANGSFTSSHLGHRQTTSESASASMTALMQTPPRSSFGSLEPECCEVSMTAQDIPDISYITTRPLLRQYTLQRAESGVAIDYHKKPNVIRVRLEGEQFLLQARDVKEVVDWIEGFQMAADVSLDLDERVMPRGPMFPRRRRRRRVPPA